MKNDHEKNMQRLKEIGYVCEHPEAMHKPLLSSGQPTKGAVYLVRDGKWPPMIYLDRFTGLVLVISERDYTIDDFVRRDASGWEVQPSKTLQGQRELF